MSRKSGPNPYGVQQPGYGTLNLTESLELERAKGDGFLVLNRIASGARETAKARHYRWAVEHGRPNVWLLLRKGGNARLYFEAPGNIDPETRERLTDYLRQYQLAARGLDGGASQFYLRVPSVCAIALAGGLIRAFGGAKPRATQTAVRLRLLEAMTKVQ